MKKMSFIVSLFLAALIFLVSSCGSNRSFSSRKYTAGNYLTHKHKPGKVNVQEAPEQEAVVVSKDEALTEKTPVAKKTDLPEEDLVATDKTVSGMVATKSKDASALKATEKETVSSSATKTERKDTKRKAFHAEAIKKYVSDRATRKAVSAGDGDGGSLDPVALVSLILGMIGLAFNIFVITLIFATGAEYIFILLLIGGLILGILALVFGIRGLRRHHEQNGSTLNLIFSIIGTVLGAVTVIPTFILVLFMLLLSL